MLKKISLAKAGGAKVVPGALPSEAEDWLLAWFGEPAPPAAPEFATAKLVIFELYDY